MYKICTIVWQCKLWAIISLVALMEGKCHHLLYRHNCMLYEWLSDGQGSHKPYSYNHTPPTYSKQTYLHPPTSPFPPSLPIPTSPFHHHHTPPPPLHSSLMPRLLFQRARKMQSGNETAHHPSLPTLGLLIWVLCGWVGETPSGWNGPTIVWRCVWCGLARRIGQNIFRTVIDFFVKEGYVESSTVTGVCRKWDV